MRHPTQMRLLAAGVAAMVALALVGPASAADPVARPDDRQTRGPGAIALDQLRDVLRPDDRATHGAGGVVAEPSSLPASYATTEASAGFDWADAGVGALGALGLVLVVAGGSVIAARRRLEPIHPIEKGQA